METVLAPASVSEYTPDILATQQHIHVEGETQLQTLKVPTIPAAAVIQEGPEIQTKQTIQESPWRTPGRAEQQADPFNHVPTVSEQHSDPFNHVPTVSKQQRKLRQRV